MPEIAAHATGTNAEPDDGGKNEERERGIGFDMRGRRLDAWNERGPVGYEDEDEQRADEGTIGTRLGSHRVADLSVDRVHNQFEERLRL